MEVRRAKKELAHFVVDMNNDIDSFWENRIDEHIELIRSIRTSPELLSMRAEVANVLGEWQQTANMWQWR
jgi:hypothetical protein